MSWSSSFWVLLFCCNVMRVSPQCQIAQACITDFSASNCTAGQQWVPNSIAEGCCPSCVPSGGKLSLLKYVYNYKIHLTVQKLCVCIIIVSYFTYTDGC